MLHEGIDSKWATNNTFDSEGSAILAFEPNATSPNHFRPAAGVEEDDRRGMAARGYLTFVRRRLLEYLNSN